MKVSGEAALHAPVDDVWRALNDPGVLARTIPGCEQLEETGPDRYRMTVTAGVASIKGSYRGEVALTDQNPPGAFRLRASGAGAPGTVSADVLVSLADGGDGTTRLRYDADAVVGGMIGGVGQRVLVGVAKKTAGEFFRNVEADLTGAAARPAPVPAPAPAGVAAGGPREAGAPVASAVFRPPAAAPSGADSAAFTRGVLVGAGVALAGVALGAVVARR